MALGCGYYAAALNYPEQERYQPYRYAADKPQEIDPALPRPSGAEPFQYRAACEQPKGREESDLCAQWKAARAAEASALWAERGFWLGIVGSAFLLWQIILTRRAVEDTGEATKAMREANKIASGAQRPWVSINVTVSKMVIKDQIVSFECSFTFENIGETIATHFVWTANIRFIAPDEFGLDNLGALDGETFERCAEHVLVPGDPFIIDGIPSSEDTPHGQRKIIYGSDGKPWAMAPIIVVSAYYRSDMFPEKDHVSIRCFSVGHAKSIIGLHHGVVYLNDMEIGGAALSVAPYGVQIAT